MAELLRDMVAAHPRHPAVIDQHGAVSFDELAKRVDRLAHALRARGLAHGDAVAAMLGNQRELIELSLACMHGGWLLVPINWHWVADEVAYVLEDAAARAFVVDARWGDVGQRAAARRPGLSIRLAVGAPTLRGFDRYEDVVGAASDPTPAVEQRGGVMFYTSGTTGFPKGVKGGLAQVGETPEIWQLMAHSSRPTLSLEDDAVQLICGPLYHSAQWVYAHFALLCGTTVVLQPRFEPAELLQLVDRHQVTNLHLVPTHMSRLLALDDEVRAGFDGSSLRSVQHGAAPCAPEVKQRMIDWWGPIVTEYYGGTEGGFLTMISAEEWLTRPTSVGRALPVVELQILGDDGQPHPAGEVGEVYFRSLLGTDFEYHNAPSKTASAHASPGWATLGDVGFLDEDGYLHLCDRKVDMVVSGGVNIYPAEIERVLAGHPVVADVAVFGVPDPDMGEQVRAAVALADGGRWDAAVEADLEAFCREHLAGYKRPRSWEVHDALPRSEAGKLQKRTLREPHWAQAERAI